MVEVVSSCEVVLMVVPTPFVARTLAPVADKFRPDGILVSCTKGILNDTLETRRLNVGLNSLQAWVGSTPQHSSSCKELSCVAD